LTVAITQVKIPRSPNVSGSKSSDDREFYLNVFGELFNDGFAPASGLLAIADESANIPIKRNQLLVDGFKGFVLSRSNPLFNFAQPLSIVRRNRMGYGIT
jgi:hypothetical protein